ncbi:MAG: PadR family transcriptional regulator, partial [Candidatus Bathyarchaeia archaeon]
MKRELKREVLLALKVREEYGYSISKILASRGNKIHLGYLYETLGEMEAEKSIKSRWEKSVGGPKRRVYSLTNKGGIALDAMLRESIHVIHHFYNAYLASLPPESNVVWTLFHAINDILPLEKAQHIVIIITFPLNPAIEAGIRLTQMKAKKA